MPVVLSFPVKLGMTQWVRYCYFHLYFGFINTPHGFSRGNLYSSYSQLLEYTDDVDIKKFNLKFLRNMIAYVPQEIMLFNDTIKNNTISNYIH